MTDYNKYSREKHINVIPENDFKELVAETFDTITSSLRSTYGPYGASSLIMEGNETTTTKDGYNVFLSLGFSYNYEKMIYLAIKNIIERVNRNVGDGTTSCILIADKLFRNIEAILSTPDEKRRALQVLDNIEKYLQTNDELTKNAKFHPVPLEKKHFSNIIRLASNYDDELTDILMKSFDPVFDENNKLVSKRNIITEAVPSDSGAINYEIKQLPGKYRVRVDMLGQNGMGTAAALCLEFPQQIKIVLFDHAFTQNDWTLVTANHDKETRVLIIATEFSRQFMDNEYLKYLKERMLVKQPPAFYIARIRGYFIQNEVHDLAAVMGQTAWSLSTHMNVDYSQIPEYTIQLHGGNCLCFDNVEPPLDYIKEVEYDMNRDLSKSIAKRNDFIKRIEALKMDCQDTMLTVKTTSPLEAKLITDKIDDCVSIIDSAATNGVVPNMLRYAYYCMDSIKKNYENSELSNKIIEAIKESICGLFDDIWKSKYLNENILTGEQFRERFYDEDNWESFNIITDEFTDPSEFCTSSQYDIEVVVAAISIIKYLITSKQFIFDANLLRQFTELPYSAE